MYGYVCTTQSTRSPCFCILVILDIVETVESTILVQKKPAHDTTPKLLNNQDYFHTVRNREQLQVHETLRTEQ